MVFLPSHHHRVTSEKVMEYTGSCPHPTPRGQGTRLLSNDVEREYTSSLQGDIQLPYATQTTSSTLNRVQQGKCQHWVHFHFFFLQIINRYYLKRNSLLGSSGCCSLVFICNTYFHIFNGNLRSYLHVNLQKNWKL